MGQHTRLHRRFCYALRRNDVQQLRALLLHLHNGYGEAGEDEKAKATCVQELTVTQYMECVQFGL